MSQFNSLVYKVTIRITWTCILHEMRVISKLLYAGYFFCWAIYERVPIFGKSFMKPKFYSGRN